MNEEVILCAVIAPDAESFIYYGRGTLSGDWFSGLDWDNSAIQSALEDGLTPAWHPYGKVMFRHKDMLKVNFHPRFAKVIQEMEELFERYPPQSTD